MTEGRSAQQGWFTRWRQRRRARRQQALERAFFLRERARSGQSISSDSTDGLNASVRANAHQTWAMGFWAGLGGGDGGGS